MMKKKKQFLADRYIKGTCPTCNFPEAYGDQCENCGSTLSPSELRNPKIHAEWRISNNEGNQTLVFPT